MISAPNLFLVIAFLIGAALFVVSVLLYLTVFLGVLLDRWCAKVPARTMPEYRAVLHIAIGFVTIALAINCWMFVEGAADWPTFGIFLSAYAAASLLWVATRDRVRA